MCFNVTVELHLHKCYQAMLLETISGYDRLHAVVGRSTGKMMSANIVITLGSRENKHLL